MKTIATLGLAAILSAGTIFAGVHGAYIEARTADVFTGACFANSESGIVGELAVMGWNIDKGSWQGVTLDGLTVVGVIKANSTLGDIANVTYPVKSVLIVDEKASPEQRLALRAFAQRMGGDLLNDIVRVDYQPIELTVQNNNVHAANATLTAGTLANIRTRGMSKGDHVCSNEEVWYQPLTKVGHFMPAYTLAHNFKGEGLGTKWSSPDKRSAFVADFQVSE